MNSALIDVLVEIGKLVLVAIGEAVKENENKNENKNENENA